MPELPTHPLVNDDDAEELQHDLRCYLALIQQAIAGEMDGGSRVANYNEVRYAITTLLHACREGVIVLSQMEALPPDNVTKMGDAS